MHTPLHKEGEKCQIKRTATWCGVDGKRKLHDGAWRSRCMMKSPKYKQRKSDREKAQTKMNQSDSTESMSGRLPRENVISSTHTRTTSTSLHSGNPEMWWKGSWRSSKMPARWKETKADKKERERWWWEGVNPENKGADSQGQARRNWKRGVWE